MRTALFLLRISVALVLFVWALDKLVNPHHAAGIFERFYHIASLPPLLMYIIGALELVLVVLFVTGVRKNTVYLLVLVFHGVSTVASYQQYLHPFSNLLFFAAIPMLAACYMLYQMRHSDTMLSLNIS